MALSLVSPVSRVERKEPTKIELTLYTYGIKGDLGIDSLQAVFSADWFTQKKEKEVHWMPIGYVTVWRFRLLRKSEIMEGMEVNG